MPTPPAHALLITAGASGFLTGIDEKAMLDTAADTGTVIVLSRDPGSSLIAGTPIGYAWPEESEAALDADTREQIQSRVQRRWRRASNEPLSTTSGMDCANSPTSPRRHSRRASTTPRRRYTPWGHSAALLCEFAGRDLGPHVLRDADDRIRVVMRRPDLSELLELAIAQPRHYGAGDVAVLDRVLALLRELAWSTDVPEHHHAIRDQLGRTRTVLSAQGFDAAEQKAWQRPQ